MFLLHKTHNYYNPPFRISGAMAGTIESSGPFPSADPANPIKFLIFPLQQDLYEKAGKLSEMKPMVVDGVKANVVYPVLAQSMTYYPVSSTLQPNQWDYGWALLADPDTKAPIGWAVGFLQVNDNGKFVKASYALNATNYPTPFSDVGLKAAADDLLKENNEVATAQRNAANAASKAAAAAAKNTGTGTGTGTGSKDKASAIPTPLIVGGVLLVAYLLMQKGSKAS